MSKQLYITIVRKIIRDYASIRLLQSFNYLITVLKSVNRNRNISIHIGHVTYTNDIPVMQNIGQMYSTAYLPVSI